MYVCICNAVTDSEIRSAAEQGVSDLWGLQSELGVAAGCGSCKEQAMHIVRETAAGFGEPRMHIPGAA